MSYRIYNYDKKTKEFVNVSTAQKNPKNPKEFLIPLYATTKAPPFNKIVNNTYKGKPYEFVYNEDKNEWDIVVDYRGYSIYYYDKKTKEFVEEDKIVDLGVDIDNIKNATIIAPQDDYYSRNEIRWNDDINDWELTPKALINRIKHKNYNNIDYYYHKYNCSVDTIMKLKTIYDMYINDSDNEFYFVYYETVNDSIYQTKHEFNDIKTFYTFIEEKIKMYKKINKVFINNNKIITKLDSIDCDNITEETLDDLYKLYDDINNEWV